MASVTSGLSAADSQNIIRATDALNKLTRSINSLDTTSRDLVKSTIRLNILLKSIDNLDRGINKFQINLTKFGTNNVSQTHFSNVAMPSSSKEADAIRAREFDVKNYINPEYDKFYAELVRRNNDLVDYSNILVSAAPPQISVPVGIAGVMYGNYIEDGEDERIKKREDFNNKIEKVKQLKDHKDSDSIELQTNYLAIAKDMSNFLSARDESLRNKIEGQYKHIEKLKNGTEQSYISNDDGEVRTFKDPPAPHFIAAAEKLIQKTKDDVAENLKDKVAIDNFINKLESNLSNPSGVPSSENVKNNLLNESVNTNSNVGVDTQTFSISFEQQKYNAINQTTEARERDIDAMVRAYELEKEKESAVSVAKDIVSQSRSPYELIDDKEKEQELAIDYLSTYQKDSEEYRLYEQAKTEIKRQASEARQSIRQNEEQMDRQATLNGLTDMNSAVTGLMGIAENARGKQSGTYKALFAMSKAFNVAQATLNLQAAIMSALNGPENLTLPQKFASMAAVASAGVQLLTSITSITMSGQAHAGIDYIPREGTWLLDRGERVVDSRTNADLKQYLSKSNGGSGGGSSVSVNVPLSIQSESSGGSGVTAEDASILAGMIKSKVYEIVSNEQRPGGLLSRG